jgi:hypothetical protein
LCTSIPSPSFTARQEYTVLGVNVNLAARLMGEAKPGHVCVCTETEDATRDLFDYKEQPAVVLKGINEGRPVKVFELEGVHCSSEEDRILETECGASSFERALARAGQGHGAFHEQHGHTHW